MRRDSGNYPRWHTGQWSLGSAPRASFTRVKDFSIRSGVRASRFRRRSHLYQRNLRNQKCQRSQRNLLRLNYLMNQRNQKYQSYQKCPNYQRNQRYLR